MNEKDIRNLLEQGLFSYLDIHFASLMMRLSGKEDRDIFIAAALVSRATTEGHVCLNLSDVEGKPLATEAAEAKAFSCPSLEECSKNLIQAALWGNRAITNP